MTKHLEITTPAELSVNGLNMLLTGQPGSGKTALLGSAANIFPNGLLILDCDGGMRTLADRNDIAVISCKKWSQLGETFEYLNEEEHNYKVVALDLASSIYKLALKQVANEGSKTSKGQPTLEARGIAYTRFLDMVRDYRTLCESRSMHVIFTSHSNEIKDDDSGVIMVRPDFTPGVLPEFVGVVDFAGFLEIYKGKRLLHLVGNERIIAKARVPLSYGKVPETIVNPTFENLLDVLLNGVMPIE